MDASRVLSRQVKPKKCGNPECRKEFVPRNSLVKACSINCGIAMARLHERRVRAKVGREARKAKREWRLRNIPLSRLLQQAQHEVNHFIRERDFWLPCISCGKLTGAKMNAGHYRTTKAASHLRFNEDNIHGQCEHCNSYLSGNLIEYRKGLVAKIGVERVEALENDNRVVKWDRDELVQIRRTYLGKWKAMKAEREARA